MIQFSVVIQVSHLGKSYRAFAIDRKESGIGLWLKNISRLTSNTATMTQALKDVSFQVHAGEVLGIFGANGAGKSTLIKILSGLLLPNEGTVCIQGIDDPDRIKDLVAYISTNGWMGLEWQLTTDENLLLYGNLFGVTGATLRSRCDAVLHLLELEAERHKHISELSAGMRQKVTLARGLILERPILYLDEPTVSLDVQSSARVREIITGIAAVQGKTVLITSHNPVDLSICDRILFLYQGRVAALGTLQELLEPMQGVMTLHVTFAGGDKDDEVMAAYVEASHADLSRLAGVRSVQLERAQGRRNHWLARFVIREAGNPINAIIDWYIAQELQIVGLQMKSVSLQELYEHYVAASNAGAL